MSESAPGAPTPPEVGGVSSGSVPAASGTRTVLAKGQRVPWPRRLIATGLLAAVLALALHALPRPYQSIPTGIVRKLGDGYGSLRETYSTDVAALPPIAGEASAAEREEYARELWRYRWFGSFREILLRFSEWLAASCMFVALSLIVVERRRIRREMAAKGAVTAPTVLRHETLAGDAITPPPPAEPPAEPPAAPRAQPEDATPPFPTANFAATRTIPLRETGDEVTPPSPTPVPSRIPGALELRPSPFDDDDLGRPTDNQAPNLAKRKIDVRPSASAPPTPGLPVFFAERRHPDAHPVVHPGDAAPASDEPVALIAAESGTTTSPAEATPTALSSAEPTPTALLSPAEPTPTPVSSVEPAPTAPSSIEPTPTPPPVSSSQPEPTPTPLSTAEPTPTPQPSSEPTPPPVSSSQPEPTPTPLSTEREPAPKKSDDSSSSQS